MLVYRKATDFCKLILHPATLLNLFMLSRRVLVEVFGSFRYKIMLSVNRNSLTSSLPIHVPFISSSCLIALARKSKTILNRSGESGHICQICDFRENGFSLFPLSMMLAISLSYIVFIMLRYIPCIYSFTRAFVMKTCWLLSKAFSASIEMTKGFCVCFY
jgi:hypothetical protein